MAMIRLCLICALLTLHILVRFENANACSSGCTCTTIPAKSKDSSDESGERTSTEGDIERDMPQTTRGRKVNCSSNPYPISSIEDINRATTIPLDTIQLDLSKNAIAVIRRGSFNRLSDLEKLDLSNNQISLIEPGAFEGLLNLERLDLSHNKLGSINASIFSGIPNLQKLSLSFNKFNTIPEGTFNDLPALRRIDFDSEYLRCDCHLQWIVKWSKDKKVRITPSTKCAVPKELKGTSLRTLKKKDLHCDRPLELPLFEIKPSKSQVVFEGDKLPFECSASVIDEHTQMYWLRYGEVVETNRTAGVFVFTQKSPDPSIILHRLVLEDLRAPHSGEWQCLVSTPQGNVSKSVNIKVLATDAPDCPEVTTKTNKGIYVWKVTVAGVKQSQPCKLGTGLVTYSCSEAGHWTNLNNSQCDFIHELTRKLQSLGTKDTNSSKILSDAKNLEKLVSAPFASGNNSLISLNPEFVNLAALAIERVSRHSGIGEEIVKSVLYSASRVMNISAPMLYEAQRQRKACTRIFRAVEQIPQWVNLQKKYSQTSDYIVMELLSVPRRQFSGVKCTRLDLALDINIYQMVQRDNSHIFVCSPDNLNYTVDTSFMKLPELTSIHIPNSVLGNTSLPAGSGKSEVRFQFIWYKTANLFQVVTKPPEDPVLKNKKWKVISGVISASLSEPAENLTEPVELTFEIPETEKKVVAVYWHLSPSSGYGYWRTDGCRVVQKRKTTVTAHCDHLSAFAILEDQSRTEGSMFHMLEIVVYAGSCMCLLCLMAVIITYVSCFRFINVPKKMKHSVINICIGITLLIIGFTMGIKRTDHRLACQIVGIGIHYLTLVVLFWITVTANNMLKKFCKAEKPPPPPVDLPMPLPPKPMLRFYLLAWGVPVIICGITAAVSFEFYDEPDYCFLEWEPGLGAFIGPVSFLVVLNLFFFLRISCVIHSSTGPLLSIEETEELPVNDIELTPNQDDTRIETRSIDSNMSSKSSVSSVMDFERRPIAQLRALVAILFFFIVTWVSGALSVATPFKSIIKQQELIFSYVYGVFSAVLGVFMLIYYCLARKDSRTSWKRFFLCEQQTVYDMSRSVPNHMPHANGHVNTGSGTDISSCNKLSNSVSTNHVKNGPQKTKLNLVPLVPSAPASVTDDSMNNSGQENAASFYNPRQNGVAKKFWEKKNKHNSKLLNKEMVKNLNLSGSQNELNSGCEAQRGHSQGYSSDANTHLSIEIQIQSNADQGKDTMVARSPTESNGAPPSYNSIVSNNIKSMPLYPSVSPERKVSSPIGRAKSPSSPPIAGVSNVGGSSQVAPNHNRTASSSSLGRTHPSAFAVVPPRNNTLPRQGKPQSPSSPSSPERELPDTNSSVPRMSDFDGQSQVSSSCSHEKHRSPGPQSDPSQFMPGFGPPQDSFISGSSVYKQYGLIDANPPPSFPGFSPQHRSRTNSGGYSSDNSSRYRRKLENNFVQQVEQRIPQDNKATPVRHKPPVSPVSPVSDSDSTRHKTPADSDSQIHYKKQKYNDSDHNSEPTSQSHRKHNRSRDSHKHSKHRGMVKQRSLDWEDEFKDKPCPQVIPYAYVNHNYTDKVLQKLQTRAMVENIDPASKAFWVPRSSSSYNEIVNEENTRLCEDDTTSSSSDDDSIDNIWVLQKQRKRKKDDKKETSV